MTRAAAQVLRVLLKLLEASRDSKTLAVGASDLGHFISAHPHGRAIVTGARSPALASASCHAGHYLANHLVDSHPGALAACPGA